MILKQQHILQTPEKDNKLFEIELNNKDRYTGEIDINQERTGFVLLYNYCFYNLA